MATELEQEFPWSPRMSFYAVVDFLATEAGMSAEEIKRAFQHKEQPAQRKRRVKRRAKGTNDGFH